MEKRSALVFGASGLVGSKLLNLLILNPIYHSVVSCGRREIILRHPKFKQNIIDFNSLESFESLFANHDIYCCLGTTIKKAKSRKAFKDIDFGYIVKIASIASKQRIENFALVSSLGANVNSNSFYLKTKGEIEAAVRNFNFTKTVILRPSILLGHRIERRIGEQIGKFVIQLFSFLLIGKLKKYRGVDAKFVAIKMIELILNDETGELIIESDLINT